MAKKTKRVAATAQEREWGKAPMKIRLAARSHEEAAGKNARIIRVGTVQGGVRGLKLTTQRNRRP